MQHSNRYQRIWQVIASIPKGSVATYGQIARLAGLGRHARLVGYALHNTPPDIELPWHRVVNAQGKIAFPCDSERYQLQKKLLMREHIVFQSERIDLQRYRWQPENDDLPLEYLLGEGSNSTNPTDIG